MSKLMLAATICCVILCMSSITSSLQGSQSSWGQFCMTVFWRGPGVLRVWQKNSADLFRQHFTRSIESRNAEN